MKLSSKLLVAGGGASLALIVLVLAILKLA